MGLDVVMRYICIALLLSACANGAEIGSGDIADTITTVEVLSNPSYVELNPTIPSDPLVGAAVLMTQKYVAKAILIEAGVEPDKANRFMDAGGWLAACHNLTIFGGFGHPIGLGVGAFCAAIYLEETKDGR